MTTIEDTRSADDPTRDADAANANASASANAGDVNPTSADPDRLESEVERQQRTIDEQARTIERLERRSRIDALLVEAGAIDVGVARTVVEASLEETGASADAAKAIAELRRRSPFLFRAPARTRPGAGSPRPDRSEADDVDQAAVRAQASGRRTDVLRYLRLKRRRE